MREKLVMTLRLFPVPRMLASESPTIVRPSECRAPSGGDGPAVAGRNPEIDARGVDRVGFYIDFYIGDVVPGSEELFGSDDESCGSSSSPGLKRRSRRMTRSRVSMCVLLAVRSSHLPPGSNTLFAVDGDFSDCFSGEGSELFRFIEDLSVRGRIEHGFHEDHPVQHSGYGPAAGFGFDAVVEPVVSGSGVGLRIWALSGVNRSGVCIPGRIPGPADGIADGLAAETDATIPARIRISRSMGIRKFWMIMCQR